MIERYGLSREFPGMTPIQRSNDRAQEYSTCRHRHRCQRDPGIGDCVGPTNLDMVPQEKAIPTRVFRFVRELSKQTGGGIGAQLGNVECVLHHPRNTEMAQIPQATIWLPKTRKPSR